MSKIEVNGRCFGKLKKLAQTVAEKVIELMNFPNDLEVSINFVSEKEIKRLNSEFRGIDRVTDVLSFPSFQLSAGENLDVENEAVSIYRQDNGLIHFGDMALCLKQTRRQAKDFDVSVDFEIKKLVIHSMLHLMGYDHIDDKDYEIMKTQEEKLENLI